MVQTPLNKQTSDSVNEHNDKWSHQSQADPDKRGNTAISSLCLCARNRDRQTYLMGVPHAELICSRRNYAIVGTNVKKCKIHGKSGYHQVHK
jgi:hypothetical protein